MPRMSKAPALYRLDLTEREAEVVRRLMLDQADFADIDNRTVGTLRRVARRIRRPNLQESAP